MALRHILTIALFLTIFNGFADTICWNIKRGFENFSPEWPTTDDGAKGIVENQNSESMILTHSLSEGNEDFELRFKVRNHHCHPSRTYKFVDKEGRTHKTKLPKWGIVLVNEDGGEISFLLKSSETGSDGVSSEPCMELEVGEGNGETKIMQFKGKTLGENWIKGISGLDPTGSRNFYKLNVKEGEIKLFGGLHSPELLYTGQLPAKFRPEEIGFVLEPGSRLEFSDVRLSMRDGKRKAVDSCWDDPELLATHLKESRDNMEGFWQILDRSLEETVLKPGGDYRFAMVKSGDGYDLIYLSGAKVNAANWQPGMMKARLSPSGIKDIWEVCWTDAMFGDITTDVKAQLESSETLQIQFPYHDSVIRLQKTR